MKKLCVRDCYDTTTSLYYTRGKVYELEEGDMLLDTKHFRSVGAKEPVTEEKAVLDPALKRKTLKFLAKKYPTQAKGIDLRVKGAHRALIYAIMKMRGAIESVEEEGKTASEHLTEEKKSKLAASRKR